MCYKEMKQQQSVIKTVKDANNQIINSKFDLKIKEFYILTGENLT